MKRVITHLSLLYLWIYLIYKIWKVSWPLYLYFICGFVRFTRYEKCHDPPISTLSLDLFDLQDMKSVIWPLYVYFICGFIWFTIHEKCHDPSIFTLSIYLFDLQDMKSVMTPLSLIYLWIYLIYKLWKVAWPLYIYFICVFIWFTRYEKCHDPSISTLSVDLFY